MFVERVEEINHREPGSSGVMENDNERVSQTAPQLANTVANVYSIKAACSRHWAVMDREHNGVSLAKWHDGHPGLHARPLFCQNEFAAREIVAWLRQEDRHLERENRRCHIGQEWRFPSRFSSARSVLRH
jgi:hypothetical protein